MNYLLAFAIFCLILSVICLTMIIKLKQQEVKWLRNEWLKSIKEAQNFLNEQAHLVGMVKDNQDARERLLKELENEE
jgi:hypothetical protein